MFGFLIKKTFYDVWDNMFRIVLVNLGFILSLAVPIILPGYMPALPLALAVAAAGVLWCCVYLAAAALSLKAVSDYGVFSLADFIAGLKAGWPAGAVMAAAGAVCFLMIKIIIPFYLNMHSWAGIVLGALVFWTLILTLIALQFFYAVRARLAARPVKIIKKCFIIFFDNPGFALGVFGYNLVMPGLWVGFALLSGWAELPLFLLLLPGPAGLLLFLDEGLRLRLLKYDWLESLAQEAATAPEAPATGLLRRRPIPWDALLIDERAKTGTRTIKNLIFPWKD